MKVVSNARKLIFRPAPGLPVVSFPEGAVVSSYGAGNGAPTIVVQNGTDKDKSWQGVSHETGSVIVNGVPGEVAETALERYQAGGSSIEALNAVLRDLWTKGYVDQYTTPLEFIETKLSPAGFMLDRYTGIVKRDDRDQVDLWQEGGECFVNPSGEARLIEPNILIRDYRMPDGSSIDLNKVPAGRPAHIKS